jgi:hypothetical protein
MPKRRARTDHATARAGIHDNIRENHVAEP